jgi:hypothetical protein
MGRGRQGGTVQGAGTFPSLLNLPVLPCGRRMRAESYRRRTVCSIREPDTRIQSRFDEKPEVQGPLTHKDT